MQTFENKTLDEVADDVDAVLVAMGSDWRVDMLVEVTGPKDAGVLLNKRYGAYRPSEWVQVKLDNGHVSLVSSVVTESPC